ncbi:MAG TPA: right-handed parallel beta-helix repeat-containing protein [Acidimicrobiales bacterium]|nr:right-handed parallel beta-helix repeat-containing protein [Acidimicrobiales bacterium]
MKRVARAMASIAATAVGMTFMAVAPVEAQPEEVVLTCGTVITEDTVLGADIGPCGDIVSEPGHTPGGHGLVIGADGVTLDLNGHTIFGLGSDVVLHQAAGVKVDEHSDVTVFGGTVRGFFHGVWVQNGARNTVRDMRSIDNTTGNGIVLQNVRDSRVFRNAVVNSGGFGGISVFDGRATDQLDDLPSANNSILSNLVDQSDNRANTAGISLENGPGHRVVGNTVTRSSGDGIILRAGSNPLPGSGRILPPATDAVVSGNVVTRNGTNATGVTAVLAGINLQRNLITGLGADRNQITGNRVQSNADHGILVASRNNRIVANTARGNAVNDLHDANVAPPCDNNVWRSNRFATANQPCVGG